MDNGLREFQKLLRRGMRVMPDKLPRIIEVEGVRFIAKNFRNQGYTDTSLKKWKKRKKKDSRGRDITRYRTSRVGAKGSLNRYGTNLQRRAILVGHDTGGNKLKNSIKAARNTKQVTFTSYKPYAKRHNEGEDEMPQRQFMGPSKYLENQIKKKLTKELDKLFKK